MQGGNILLEHPNFSLPYHVSIAWIKYVTKFLSVFVDTITKVW